jgi:DNA-binding FadR family transcriptional regulator
MSKVAESIHLPDEIAKKLVKIIQSKSLSTGDRLPSERELCDQFSVSRPVIREALTRLKSEGLVNIKRGVGVFVSERDNRESFKLQDVLIDDKASINQVMELISTFEVAATSLAAKRRTPEDLKKIRKGLIGIEYAIANDRLGDEEDYEFHEAIVLATHNPHFQNLSKHLEHTARRMIRQLRSNTRSRLTNMVEAVQTEHQAIYDAIEKGDAEAAGVAARTHLENAEKRITKYLKG